SAALASAYRDVSVTVSSGPAPASSTPDSSNVSRTAAHTSALASGSSQPNHSAHVAAEGPAHAMEASASRSSTPPPGKTVIPAANFIAATLRCRKTSMPSGVSRSSITVAASLGTTGSTGVADAASSGSGRSGTALLGKCKFMDTSHYMPPRREAMRRANEGRSRRRPVCRRASSVGARAVGPETLVHGAFPLGQLGVQFAQQLAVAVGELLIVEVQVGDLRQVVGTEVGRRERHALVLVLGDRRPELGDLLTGHLGGLCRPVVLLRLGGGLRERDHLSALLGLVPARRQLTTGRFGDVGVLAAARVPRSPALTA